MINGAQVVFKGAVATLQGRFSGILGAPMPARCRSMSDSRHPFEDFRERRERGNEKVLATDSLAIKRFFALDKTVYAAGALPENTKELLGLVASAVLRCNDCIDYHLERCTSLGYSDAEIEEALSVALMVGGSIVIPHARHAAESLAFLRREKPPAD